MYPEIHYQIEESRQSGGARTATVFGCYGVSPEIYLPAQIHGVPVTKIGDYGFAKTDEKRSLFIFLPEEEGHMPEERRRLCGELVEEVHLPSQVWEIGRYAFYRCSRLKRLSFTDSLQSIEGGAFTGCQLARLDIACRQTRRTCLRQFLEEQRFELEVRISYEDGDNVEVARLIFPEHYEEAVENTPARIVETHYHGAGGDYRQCVYHKEIDYEEYDSLFAKAKARESVRTLIEIALARLCFPYRLSEQAREEYTSFLRKCAGDTADLLFVRDDMETVLFLLEHRIWEGESLEEALDKAQEIGQAEAAALLLSKRRGTAGKKTFEL